MVERSVTSTLYEIHNQIKCAGAVNTIFLIVKFPNYGCTSIFYVSMIFYEFIVIKFIFIFQRVCKCIHFTRCRYCDNYCYTA